MPSFIIPPINADRQRCLKFAEPQLTQASLAPEILERHPELEGVAPPEVAGRVIVPPPRDPDLEAIVVVGDADAVADRLVAVGERERILFPIGEVDDRGAED